MQLLAKRLGIWEKWEYSHPFVQAAAEQFGTFELSTLPADGVNTARVQFMRIYESVKGCAREKRINARVLNSLGQKKLEALCQGLGNDLAITEKAIS